MDWAGLGWIGMDWVGLGWTGLDWAGPGWIDRGAALTLAARASGWSDAPSV